MSITRDDARLLLTACTPCNSRKGAKFVAFMVATRKPVYL